MPPTPLPPRLATKLSPRRLLHTAQCQRGVLSKDITDALRHATAIIGHTVGFHPGDILARSLQAGGTMALLCADVDPDVIRLLGHWKSDTMFRYLFVQAHPLVNQFAHRMLTDGDFDLLPGTDVALLKKTSTPTHPPSLAYGEHWNVCTNLCREVGFNLVNPSYPQPH